MIQTYTYPKKNTINKEALVIRYHYEKPNIFTSMYGEVYKCDHPVYSKCTLYKIGEKGLSIIQQRYDEITKNTYWEHIDPWLTDVLYLHPKFKDFFDDRADHPKDNLYPTVSIRQIMWALKMKPIPRERWETYFDRKLI